MLRRLSQQRAQGLVEFAVIFPIFAFLLFAVIDGGLLMGRYNNINNGAKEGARLGAVGAGQTDIVDRVMAQTHGLLTSSNTTTDCGLYGTTDNAICVQWITGVEGEPPGTVGASIRVKVKYTYQFLTPLLNWIGAGGWTVEACAIQREEQAIANPPNISSAQKCSDP